MITIRVRNAAVLAVLSALALTGCVNITPDAENSEPSRTTASPEVRETRPAVTSAPSPNTSPAPTTAPIKEIPVEKARANSLFELTRDAIDEAIPPCDRTKTITDDGTTQGSPIGYLFSCSEQPVEVSDADLGLGVTKDGDIFAETEKVNVGGGVTVLAVQREDRASALILRDIDGNLWVNVIATPGGKTTLQMIDPKSKDIGLRDGQLVLSKNLEHALVLSQQRVL